MELDVDSSINIKQCPVCGNNHFSCQEILWPDLIESWELNSYQIKYINAQQGFYCVHCQNNLRSMALAHAILSSYQFSGNLLEFSESILARQIKILEINEAGQLNPILSKFPQHQLINYPENDMQQLTFQSNSFDLVIHSDTLEHVPQPIKALSECYRVLTDSGRCIFTVPILTERLTRSRADLPHSYHGSEEQCTEDLLVHTEFGADAWCYVAKAGFQEIKLHSFNYPSGLAIEGICKKQSL